MARPTDLRREPTRWLPWAMPWAMPWAIRRGLLACLILAVAGLVPLAHAGCDLAVDAGEARVLADKVWRNESGGDPDKLLWWNRGEDFASLGIGHFIWYPPGAKGPFHESFPELLMFLSARGVALPGWLAGEVPPDSPWRTREQFLDARNGPRAAELERLLVDTAALQAQFMLARLQRAVDVMVDGLPSARAMALESRVCALAGLPPGRYALVDYVNFKGEGVNPRERYAGQGWGLRQVLEDMDGRAPANVDFADAAARVLERRVRNAPPERREQRWLAGWLRRVDTYRED